MPQGNNTLWLALFIIIGFPVVFWLAGWIAVKLWREPKFGRPHTCPRCQRLGTIGSFGAYKCISCGQVFYINESGKVVPSLLAALKGQLVFGLAGALLLIGINIYLALPWWDCSIYWMHILSRMSVSISKKKFPAEV